MPACSIIIPVFNKWKLTRNCLHSLAATIGNKEEIIILDNASTDETAHACPPLGKELFGDSFLYVRNDINRNFAGASNQGAQLAKGEYLVFLNNDTVTQPGWLEPLLEDFKKYPDIAATGPLLVYPEETPLGRLVQHLGAAYGPFKNPFHLYNGIPAASPLAKKRRFFQVITAACMVIPKQLFMETGQFDEGFINGFEDVDLCARLWQKGFFMTVNPDSLVIHYESQSIDRHKHDEENSQRFKTGSLALISPDIHLHLNSDDMSFHINEWCVFEPLLSDTVSKRIDTVFAGADPGQLKDMLCVYPFWKTGWELLLEKTRDLKEKLALASIFLKLFGNPQNLVPICALALKKGNKTLFKRCLMNITNLSAAPTDMLSIANTCKQWCLNIGLEQIAAEYDNWIHDYPNFCANIYPNFARDFLNFVRRTNIIIAPSKAKIYDFWSKSATK